MANLLKNKIISVAPMMDWSDRHCRYFMRLLNPTMILSTEMVTTGAIIHGDKDRFLRYNPEEHPVSVQLGGSDPKELAQCAAICEQYGYGEINLNVGCPSDRVQRGMIGACLMAHPKQVADCVAAMKSEVSVPVTVKTRIGIDDQDSYDFLCDFVGSVRDGGCETIIIHARKAWLQGLSPKQNREIPPLDYERVYQLKKDFPKLTVVINGGITTLNEIEQHCLHVDGVMIGRAAYKNPQLLQEIAIACGEAPVSLQQVVQGYLDYCETQLSQGVYLGALTRHILGLFQGCPGAKRWRRHLSENAHRPGAGTHVIADAFQLM